MQSAIELPLHQNSWDESNFDRDSTVGKENLETVAFLLFGAMVATRRGFSEGFDIIYGKKKVKEKNNVRKEIGEQYKEYGISLC